MGRHTSHIAADVCVIGAGVVGLAHALEARRRGCSVVILEEAARAVGASVRNFGHLFFGSQPDGPVFETALRSRERWLELGRRAGLGLVDAGTLIVARAPDELALLETALTNPDRRAVLLDRRGALDRAPIASAGVLGALHSGIDLRVDPRTAVAALAALLDADPQVRLLWNTRAHGIRSGAVEAGATSGPARSFTVRAERSIVCPGPDFRRLAPELGRGLEALTRCRLQMLRVRLPDLRRIGPALATGLSLIRYPAWAARPEAGVLRSRFEDEAPELLERGIHLLLTQLPDGDLILGDSHAYGETLEPFSDERTDALLLGLAERLLGARLEVRERWQGLYATAAHPAPAPPPAPAPGSSSPYRPFWVTRPLPGVQVVQNVAGIGMTLSLGYAAEVLDDCGPPAGSGLPAG